MPLADLQRGMAWVLLAGASPSSAAVADRAAWDDLQLSPGERAWLARLPVAHGVRVTCEIQRWWRDTKLQTALRLTPRALGESRDATIAAYLDTRACPSLFYLPEALGFLDFVVRRCVDATHGLGPHVAAVARFERAYLLAQEAARADGAVADEVITFAAPVIELFAALLAGRPLPPVGPEAFAVLVSPRLPGLWRQLDDPAAVRAGAS